MLKDIALSMLRVSWNMVNDDDDGDYFILYNFGTERNFLSLIKKNCRNIDRKSRKRKVRKQVVREEEY